MYPVTDRWKPLMAVTREGAQLYQVVSVRDERLSYESRTADGTLVDAFSLSRRPAPRPGGATILSEGLAGGVRRPPAYASPPAAPEGFLLRSSFSIRHASGGSVRLIECS